MNLQNVHILGHTKNLQLPVELDNGTVFVYQNEHIVTIERENQQFKLECNFKYDLCTLELSGWYYGKTAGLLGTMNNEKIDDALSSTRRLEYNISKFAHSWSLETDIGSTRIDNSALKTENDEVDTSTKVFCRELFTNKSSEFSACFSIIEPTVYHAVCSSSASDHEACGIAMSYLQTCMFHDTYLRIPNKCAFCETSKIDDSKVLEGDFRKLEGESNKYL